MIKKLIHQLLEQRHYWRRVGFDELSELYTSTMMRSLGLSLVGIFIPYYLYTLGVPLPDVFLYLLGTYFARLLFNVISGYMVAGIGPKHTILASNLAQIAALGFLLTLPSFHWPLWIPAVLGGASLSLFFVAYHVDFSKVIHAEHGGKELGFMTIMERVGAALGPVVGGIIAAVFGPEYTITAAIVMFVGAAIPLFFSAEPTRLRQKLLFRGLPYRSLGGDAVSRAMMGADNMVSLVLWPLYIGVALLTVNAYANLGIVTSVGIVASILTAYFLGRVVDRDDGLLLLRWSVGINSIVHLLRPLVAGFSGVGMLNIANEVATAGYMMPYTKGMYGRAEDLPGFRIVYVIFMEVMVDVGKVFLLFVVWVMSLLMDPLQAIVVAFFIVAVTSTLIAAQNFPALHRRGLSLAKVY